jgi:alkanesulfonate monooxygenase SsuD/methylene tetrahydromethanopterin reductase-like flavin-dependent oxidoreductase (luciferase family)
MDGTTDGAIGSEEAKPATAQHALRFGILILQVDPWRAILERVRRYEAAGLDTVWMADHFVHFADPTGPWLEAWTLLAGLAVSTSRIRLGPLVSHAIYRNPAILARQAMTVDQLSGGRLELGLGTGASAHDWRIARGEEPWPFAERVERFSEMLEIVDRLLRGETTTYRGRYHRVADATLVPGPLQRPRPPLTLAASGPRMVRLAARYADTWVTEGNYRELRGTRATAADVLRLTRERGELLSHAAAALGRDPGAVRRAFVAGFSPGLETPWASPGAFSDFVGTYRDIGCSVFGLPEPNEGESGTFERVVGDLIPTLRQTA